MWDIILKYAPLGTLLSAITAAITLIIGYRAFRNQSPQHRAEVFFAWNKWFDSEKGFGVGSLAGGGWFYGGGLHAGPH